MTSNWLNPNYVVTYLPADFRTPDTTLCPFKRHLRPTCFSSSQSTLLLAGGLSTVRPAPLWLFSEFGAVYKYPDLLTYLLTYTRKLVSHIIFSSYQPFPSFVCTSAHILFLLFSRQFLDGVLGTPKPPIVLMSMSNETRPRDRYYTPTYAFRPASNQDLYTSCPTSLPRIKVKSSVSTFNVRRAFVARQPL